MRPSNNLCCATGAVEAAFLPNAVVERVTLRKRKGVAISLCSGTRPDLAYSMNLLARFSAKPSTTHWEALDILIGYLKQTMKKCKLKINIILSLGF
jgi:hypothetical protein